MTSLQLRKRRPGHPPEEDPNGYYSTEEEDDDDEDEEDESKQKQTFPCQLGSLLVIFSVVALVIVLMVHQQASKQPLSSRLDFRERQIQSSARAKKPLHVEVIMEEEEGLDELPPLELDTLIVQRDAFGVAQRYLKNFTSSFMKEAQNLQARFSRLYGGIRPARFLLQHSLLELGTGDAWVQRLLEKRNQAIHMIILGDETPAGYGNYHNQAFSFELETMLKPVFNLFQIDFRITNVAIEHVATFPYMWCIPEFVGPSSDIDVVYVDLGSTLEAVELERVLRQVLGLAENKPPLIILRDSKQNEERMDLLQQYQELLSSPVLLDWKEAVEPFLSVKPSRRPLGFQNWLNWGAQKTPVTRGWTPAQHQLVAWVLCMFYLKQLELMVASEEGFYQLQERQEDSESENSNMLMSPILAKASELRAPWFRYLYYPSRTRSCRTSFHPVSNLKPVSGSATTADDPLLEHPKGMAFYHSGWVKDLENAERKEKLQSQHLGFLDVLASYHGLPTSGILEFDLENVGADLIVCESQEARQQQACRLDRDMAFTANGKPVEKVRRIETDAVAYRGKQHCLLLALGEAEEGSTVRLSLQVTNKKVALSSGPCSISHIIWQRDEQKGWLSKV
jgi:hypothetical protein